MIWLLGGLGAAFLVWKMARPAAPSSVVAPKQASPAKVVTSPATAKASVAPTTASKAAVAPALAAKKLNVYITYSCPHSQKLLQHLSERGVLITLHNAESQGGYDALLAIEKITKSRKVPQLVLGNEFVLGWDKSRVDALIDKSLARS